MSEQIKERLHVSYGRCESCGHIAEYYFDDMKDSTESCSACFADSAKIYAVIVWKA